MNSWTISIIVFVVFILISNSRDIIRAVWTAERKHPKATIQKEGYKLFKPAGFYEDKQDRLFSIYHARSIGALTIKDGRQIQESFNCAWAVVSVTPGDCIEICRKVAKDYGNEVISEHEETTADGRIMTITTRKKTETYLVIETTHKAIFSEQRQKTYELRVSVMAKVKEKYGRAASQILERFKVGL